MRLNCLPSSKHFTRLCFFFGWVKIKTTQTLRDISLFEVNKAASQSYWSNILSKNKKNSQMRQAENMIHALTFTKKNYKYLMIFSWGILRSNKKHSVQNLTLCYCMFVKRAKLPHEKFVWLLYNFVVNIKK